MPIGQGYVGLGKEATFGTAVSPTVYIPAKSAEAKTDPQFNYPEVIKSNRARTMAVPMGQKHEGSLELDVEVQNIGHILLAALGSVSTTTPDGTGAPTVRQHIFTGANTLPSYTVEKYDTLMTERVSGVKVDSLQLSVEAGNDGTISAEVSFLAQSRMDQAASGTPSYTDNVPLAFHQATVQIGGAANDQVRTFELEITNNLKDDHYTIRPSKDVAEINEGMREVSGSIEMYFKNKQDFLDFKNNQSKSITITFTGPTLEGTQNETLKVELPKTYWDAFETPMSGPDEELVASLEFTAVYDSASAFDIKVTLVNTVTGY